MIDIPAAEKNSCWRLLMEPCFTNNLDAIAHANRALLLSGAGSPDTALLAYKNLYRLGLF